VTLKGLSAVCAALLTVVPALAQDRQSDMMFAVSVKLKLISRGAPPSDVGENSKVTVTGQPLTIKLDGKTIQGFVVFTVYAEKDKPMFLLTQIQLLVQEEAGKEGQYISILRAIPFAFGDTIEFYPLGKDSPSADNILLEVKVDLHQAADVGKGRPSPAPTPSFPAGGP
jgi:hypothetical protein